MLFPLGRVVPAPVTDRLKATDRGMARGNFGERLKRERELREVTLEEITQATRIGSGFMQEHENEEWEKLHGGVFNRRFVRSIAHYLGLDEEAFLAEYDMAHAAHADQQAQKHALRIEDRIPPTPLWIPVALVAGILLLTAAIIVAGVYGWRRFVKHSTAKPAASITAPVANTSLDASASLIPAPNQGIAGIEQQSNAGLGSPGTSRTITLINKKLRQGPAGKSQS